MTDWAGLATLIAAVLAALLSAVSLVLSGRREDRRWKREVLRETMVSLFDASFGYVDKAAYQARKSDEHVDWHRERALDSHAAQMTALTRLRFLANRKVVKLAFEMHDADDRIYGAVFKNLVDQSGWDTLIEERRQARIKLFNACRRNLGLPRTLPIGPSDNRLGPTVVEIVEHERLRQLSSRRRSLPTKTGRAG